MKKLFPVVFFTVVFFSCKKDNDQPPAFLEPIDTDEMWRPAQNKRLHFLFNGSVNDTGVSRLRPVDSSGIAYGPDRFGRENRALLLDPGVRTPRVITPGLNATFPFTLSFWMKPGEINGTHRTLVRSDLNATNNYYGYWLQLYRPESGVRKIMFSFGNGEGSSYENRNTAIASANIVLNTWHHIVIVVRGKDDMDFYINNNQDQDIAFEGDATTMQYSTGAPSGIIGAYGLESQNYAGSLDDLRVYDRALTSAEVAVLYNFQP